MLEKVRIYPFGERTNPPATKVLRLKEGGRSVANAPRGMEYWERLAHWIDEERVEERDRAMMAMLRSIGIEKGKPFRPDGRLKKILTEAALVGEAMAKANDFDKRQMPLAHYRHGSRWDLALCLDVNQEADFYTELVSALRGSTKPRGHLKAWLQARPASARFISVLTMTKMAIGSTAPKPTGCGCLPTHRLSSSGP
jgi:hypothetical protein